MAKDKLFNIKIDSDLHKQFQTWCVERDVKMSVVLRDFIRACVENRKPR